MCDGIDDDCSGTADEDFAATTESEERASNGDLAQPVPTRTPDADLTY